MENKQELFSVAILCYRNYEYIYNAIDSVLEQDYPQIELIVSDDGSDSFPKEEIQHYIQKNKKDNIVSLIVRCSEKNEGTVAHLNRLIDLVTGRYIVFLACDDALYDEKVLTRYVQGLAKAPDDCVLEMAHTAMYDHALENFIEYYLSPSNQKMIEGTVDYNALYRALCYSACLPTTSTCYTKDFFEKYGKFDTGYRLIEDVPLHFRIAREHIPLHFENFVAIKHRSGGISHGAAKALSRSKAMYFEDSKNINKKNDNEIHALAPEIEKEIKRKHKAERRYFDAQIYGKSSSLFKKLQFFVMHPFYTFKKVCCKLAQSNVHYLLRNGLMLLAGLLWVLPILNQILSEVTGASLGLLFQIMHAVCGGCFYINLAILLLILIGKMINWKNDQFTGSYSQWADLDAEVIQTKTY